MTFSETYNSVADQFGDTSSAMITRIKRYINWTQQDVCSKLPTADFLYDSATISLADGTSVYSLATDAEKVIDILATSNKWRLDHVSREDLDELDPARTSEGTPYYWTEAGRDASGNMQIELYPTPDATGTLNYNYRKASSDLVSDGDKSIIPSKYHRLLYLGAVAQCYDYDQDPTSQTYWVQYDNLLETAKIDLMSGSEDTKTTFTPYGSTKKAFGLRLPPDKYHN